jgi:hypothetical protein
MHLQLGSSVLGGIALLFILPIYYFWRKGPQLRRRSRFARQVEEERENRVILEDGSA